MGGGREIVDANAMQFYRGMDIGTAKLPVAQRHGIPHHQLDVLDVTATATVRDTNEMPPPTSRRSRRAATFRSWWGARCSTSNRCWTTGRSPPPIPRCGRNGSSGSPRSEWAALHAELAERDPAAAASILASDGRRMVSALEVVELTGQPFAASAPVIGTPRWNTAIIGLDCETEVLDQRLARRTETMFDDGLVDEVIGLLDHGLRDGVTASRALGYAQVSTTSSRR